MKSTTYIVEITNQKNEKYLSEGRNLFACLPLCLLASCQVRNFPREITEKSFAIFDQSSCMIYLTCISPSYFSGNFLLPFPLWYYFTDSSQIKGRGYIFQSSIACKRLAEVFFSIES